MNGPARPPCRCTDGRHPAKRVVLTGGPGAGKTAALEIVRREFCEHVLVLDEAASILFRGGFPRRPTDACVRAAQRAIFRVQRELEQIAEEESSSALVLCDRGTLDGLAYWPGDPDGWLAANHTTMDAELKRYHAVIHLRVPTLEHGYQNSSHPQRIESAREAMEIDRRIARIWSAHPRRTVIDSHPDFLVKVARVVEVIAAEVPACCAAGA